MAPKVADDRLNDQKRPRVSAPYVPLAVLRKKMGLTLEAVCRHIFEETGMRPIARRGRDLGAGFFPSHGQSTEKVHLRAFQVDPEKALDPAGDGSVNEAGAGTIAIEARRIIDMCRAGLIEDPKLEVGVSRLLRLLSPKNPRKG